MKSFTLTNKLHRVFALMLTIAALMAGQSAWAASTFTIEASHDNSTNKTTFTITRSGSSLPQQTINYRTVNLSAFAGQHYAAVSGTYTFPANEGTKTVEVAEYNPNTDAYKYQNTAQRSYRFEVLDVNGFELQHYDRTYDTGIPFSSTKVSQSVTDLVMMSNGNFSSGMNSSKYLDVSFTLPSEYVEADNKNGLEGYVLIDDSYDYANTPAVVSTNSLINSTNASASYLKQIGYKIYATVCFTEKERDDGYQYVQIIAGSHNHSYDGADGNGKIDKGPTNSVYKACFELSNNTNATGKAYFPHRGTGTDEFSLSTGKLWQQKYKSDSYNGNGSVILDPDVTDITTRFDAGGDNDDTWGYKDFFVRMALCDAIKPTLLNNSTNVITVSGGPYVKGNTFYISVPFSEIVHISGASKQLKTSWGPVTYESGDYTNVITFKGTITANADTVLAITSINNSLFNDLSGNYYAGNDDSFDKTFNGGHTINAATGLELRESHTPPSMEERIYGFNPRSLSGSRMDWETMATTGIESLMSGTTNRLASPSVTKSDVKHRYASYYLTANYTYKYKYNASASIRWDEADLFGLDTREQKHPLWSVGAGWTLTEEQFMKGTASWLSYLKLRASYGVNGNVDQSSTTYFVAKYKKMSTSLQPLGQGLTYLDYDGDDLPNPKLRWEKTATTNIGLDFRLFKNLIRGNIEYYNRHGSDLLVRRFMDSTLGTDSRVVNNGEIRNRGLEMSITGNVISTDDWNFSVTLTHAINSNKVIAVDEDPNWVASNYITSPTNYFKKGTSYNTLWAYRLGRVVNGYPVILDADGNEMVKFDANGNVEDLTHASTLKGTDALVNMGTITPKYNGSVGLNLRYKQFELNALFVYAGGNKLRLDVADLSESGYNMRSTHILDRWTAANTEGVRMYLDMDDTGRQFASDFDSWWRYSDQQVKDADYLKLRSISMAYNLPQSICKKMRLSNLRLTLQTNNLFYWSKVGKDIDPESYSLGYGSRTVNQPRTFSIGLSTSF